MTTAAPLHRNRDFLLLQAGSLLSSAGSQVTAIAYPLLVLALTGSPAKAGAVAFVRLLGMALLSLPAGLAADHWRRKRLMIAAHAVRALAIGALAVLVLAEEVEYWVVVVVAFVEGGGAAVFGAAHPGAFRAVVPTQQLPSAVAVVTGREAAVRVASPALGGALFGIARALPFVVHAVFYLFSSLALILMRTPFQEEREVDRSSLRTRLAEGFRFLWRHPFLELWTWVGCGLFVVWPNVYVLAASIVPNALVIPSTDSVVHSYRLAMTPDRLLGRMASVWTAIALLIAPLGPLVAGFLLDAVSARATITVFAAVGLVLALRGTLSRSIRMAPSLVELSATPIR